MMRFLRRWDCLVAKASKRRLVSRAVHPHLAMGSRRYCDQGGEGEHDVPRLTSATIAALIGWAVGSSRQEDAQGDPWGPTQECPFEYPELTAAIAHRVEAAQKLETYMQTMAVMRVGVDAEYKRRFEAGVTHAQQEFATAWHRDALATLRTEIMTEYTRIVYGAGVGPRDRQRFVDTYGCARWTPQALNVIATHGPIVEIGAGGGQWLHQLRQLGVDAIGYDTFEDEGKIPGVGQTRHGKSIVVQGDETALAQHQDRTLLLVYPPPPDREGEPCMATRCLENYQGDTLLYVGEGRGGTTASSTFFDVLEAGWVCSEIVRLDPFPQCCERLFVLRRTTL